MSQDFGENTYSENSRHKIKKKFYVQHIIKHTFNKNLNYYFEYLSPHEQLKELNEMVAYFSKKARCYHNTKNTLSKIVSLKDMKKDILSRMHAQM